MKSVWLALVVLAAACGSKQPQSAQPPAPVVGNAAATTAEPPPPVVSAGPPLCRPGDHACGLRAMEYFKRAMCDCAVRRDKDCGYRVTDEMTAWAQKSVELGGPMDGASATTQDAERIEEVGKQLGECTTQLLVRDEGVAATGSPPPPPASAPPAAPANPPPGRQLPVGPAPGPKPGCGSTAQVGTPACTIEVMTWYADAMCACTSQQCGTDLADDMSKWAEAVNRSSRTNPSDAQTRTLEAIGKRLGECVTDVMMNTP